jgi:putative endonuclease
MYYVYVLISQIDKKLYVGYTTNIQKRISEHKSGKVRSTKFRRPLKIIYCEIYTNEKEAKRREVYLKGGNGRKQLKQQIPTTLKKNQYKHLP